MGIKKKLSIPNLETFGLRRWLITTAVMLAAVVEVLDMTIVNVALSHMMGALGATRDQVTWVLTSYIVSAAIVMPLTGFLVNLVGRKRILLINIAGFTIASGLCGISTSLAEMVFFRILQGIFGASLIPLSQYVILDTFTKQERGKAMAIWGMGIMTGPILGPTLGGYITEMWNWRWIFYINIPVCSLAFLMTWYVIQETPRVKRVIDGVGLLLVALGIGSLQIFLDRGQTDDWFESKHIIILFCVSLFCLSLFIIRGLKKENNIINLQLFKNINFTYSCSVMMLFAMGVFSLIALQPLMLQGLMGYPADLAGLTMGPRGISSLIGMLIVARSISFIDPRWFLLAGLSILALTSFMMSHFNLATSFNIISSISFLQGFGVGFFFVPLSTIAFSTLPAQQHAEASGLFNFARSLGVSIGISIISTYLARASQTSWNNLAGHFYETNNYFQQWLQIHHLTIHDSAAIRHLSAELGRQSGMIAFVNTFWFIGLFFICAIPFIFFLKPSLKTDMNVSEF